MGQGKRKDQIDYSYRMTFWSLIGIVVMAVILTCTDTCNKTEISTDNIDLSYPDEDVMWIGGDGDTIWE